MRAAPFPRAIPSPASPSKASKNASLNFAKPPYPRGPPAPASTISIASPPTPASPPPNPPNSSAKGIPFTCNSILVLDVLPLSKTKSSAQFEFRGKNYGRSKAILSAPFNWEMVTVDK